jgi:enoyl-CoA hydratase/carnithine racemase
MQLHQNHFGAYRGLKLTREDNGVLVVEFNSSGGPCTFSALHHTEVVDAFHRIAQDRANKIVILTGAGGDFIIGVDWSSFGDSQIRAFGARFTTKAPRFWKT